MTLLPDTSVWIDYFHGQEPTASALDDMLSRDQLVCCGPVLAGLLAGASERERAALWLAVGSLPVVELDSAAWRDAGEIASRMRGGGSVVPLLDVLIAVAALRSGATLWTRDADFERIRAVVPALELRPAGP